MRIHPTRNPRNESGAALAVSLILLTVASAVGITAVQLASDRERESASYRQHVDAMTAAELGARIARRDAIEWIRANGWPDDQQADGIFDDDWEMLGPEQQGFSPAQRYRISFLRSEEDDGTDFLIFQAEGGVQRAGELLSLRAIEVTVRRVPGDPGGIFPFEDGVIGCDGVNQVGSAAIDSFSSAVGPHGAVRPDGTLNRQTGEVRVRTINPGANATFSGNAPVYGDVAVTGNLTMNGATPIYGNLVVDGNGGTVNGTITGTSSFGGNVNFGNASNVQGPVLAGGNVTVGSTANPPPSVTAGGNVSFPNWWVWDPHLSTVASQYSSGQGNLDIPSAFVGDECDPLSINNPNTMAPGQMFDDVWDNPATQTLSDYFDGAGCPQCYSSGPQGFQLTGGQGNEPAEHTVIGSDGQTTMLRVDSQLGTQGRLQSLTIRGDVTLVVDGNFSISGSTQLNIAPNANLSLLVTGNTTLGAGSNVLTDSNGVHQPFVRNEKPAFSLYSSQVSGSQHPGVTISGSNASRVSVYAPNTAVRVTGSGSLFGSVRAGFLDLRGSGNVHYDTMLGELQAPGNGGGPAADDGAFGGWWEGR